MTDYSANDRKRTSPGWTKSDHHTAAYVQRHIYVAVIGTKTGSGDFHHQRPINEKKRYKNSENDGKITLSTYYYSQLRYIIKLAISNLSIYFLECSDFINFCMFVKLLLFRPRVRPVVI